MTDHMPAPDQAVVGGSNQPTVSAPAHCYRVLMRDADGQTRAPVIAADSEDEAATRAAELFGAFEVVVSKLMHTRKQAHGPGHSQFRFRDEHGRFVSTPGILAAELAGSAA